MDYYGYNDYGYTNYDAATAIFGGVAIFILIAILISLTISIIQLIGMWKMFKKAGKGGWESLIPFYKEYVLIEISGLNWWWFLLIFSPLVLPLFGLAWLGVLVPVFVSFNCYYNLSKKFNKGIGFAICLTLFSPICIPILGFAKDNVYSNVPVSNNGVFPMSGANNNSNYNYQNNGMQQPSYSDETVNVNNQDTANNPQQQYAFCGNCGTKLDSNVRFCPNCGKERI